MDFDYEIEFHKGKKNVTIDALSRVASNRLNALALSIISTNLVL